MLILSIKKNPVVALINCTDFFLNLRKFHIFANCTYMKVSTLLFKNKMYINLIMVHLDMKIKIVFEMVSCEVKSVG